MCCSTWWTRAIPDWEEQMRVVEQVLAELGIDRPAGSPGLQQDGCGAGPDGVRGAGAGAVSRRRR